MAQKILFVCTGNICRSPMAEGLLRKMTQAAGIELEVRSAGLAAFPGVPAAPEAVEAGREKGFDLSSHQSQPLGKSLVMESDLILTMTGKHKDMILKKMPVLEGKVRLFSEFAGAGVEDIEDPMGSPLEVYRGILNRMEIYIRGSMDRFK